MYNETEKVVISVHSDAALVRIHLPSTFLCGGLLMNYGERDGWKSGKEKVASRERFAM